MENLEVKTKYLMSDTERVQDFQRKIYRKAKQDSKFRFYILYDKLTLPHFIKEAYRLCKKNRGAPGVDGITFNKIDTSGVETFNETYFK